LAAGAEFETGLLEFATGSGEVALFFLAEPDDVCSRRRPLPQGCPDYLARTLANLREHWPSPVAEFRIVLP
jgi:hypothetical protein